MSNIDMGNPPNVGTLSILASGGVAYVPWLPLRPRAARPEGIKPDIATVPVGNMYIGVGVYNNPPIPESGTADVLSGSWLPVSVEAKEPKPSKPKNSTIIVPYRTVYGPKRPPSYKHMLLVQGIKGAIVAPHQSECIEVLRSGDEVLLLVNANCAFTVTALNGQAMELTVTGGKASYTLKPTQDTQVEAQCDPTAATFNQRPVVLPPDVDGDREIFELWHKVSFTGLEHLFDESSEDKEWLELLGTTVKAMYPRWSRRIAHIYPEPPYRGVCIPLSAATHNSPNHGSQWAIDSQYFAGFYDACGINADLGAGAMPASRLLMRCLYEMVWLSKAPKAEHPQEGSVLLTIPALFD